MRRTAGVLYLLQFACTLPVYPQRPALGLEEAESESSTTIEPGGDFDLSSGTSGSSSSSSGVSPSPGTSTNESGNFIVSPDIPPGEEPCDTFEQDCPEGQKCIFRYDQNYADWLRVCVEVHPQPHAVGEPCQIWGDTDDCIHGALCWDPDPVTGIGMCVEICGGTAEAPECETPETFCSYGKSIQLCLQRCDPREDDACPVGCGCYFATDEFMCVLDASGELGAHGDPCEYVNACDPGRLCIDGERMPDCEALGCCTTPCDTAAPACPDPALACVPFYDAGSAPAGLETLGVCILPE